MMDEEINFVKLIILSAVMLMLIFLIVAIDNKIVKVVLGFALVLSLGFVVLSFVFKKKKKSIPHREVKFVHPIDEGFVIKKVERNSSRSMSEMLSPREEFKEMLRKVLILVKNNVVADSVAFYWSNEDKKQMVLEEGITDLGFNFVRRYNWDNDALSTVARIGITKLIGDINPSAEEDILKYQSPKVGCKSLLVCPVFYKNKTVGVILLDSKQAQTFSDDDVKNVELFSELISNLIGNYITKFELYQKAKILEIATDIKTAKTHDLLIKVQDFATKVLDCVAIAVVLYENDKWLVALGYSKLGKYIEAGAEVKLEGTLVGEVINSGLPKVILSTRTQGKVIRFTDDEKINIESSIAAVPIIYGRKCYGVILLEHPKPNFFVSSAEVKKIEELATLIGMFIENENLNELVENYFIYDEETNLMKVNYFYNQLDNEIERKIKHGGELTLILISIDNIDYIQTTYGDEATKVIYPHIADIIRSNINRYDLFGRLEDNLIGVALVEIGANDAYLWAERLRKSISNLVIKFGDKSFSVTITAGLSAWDGDKNATEFIDRVKRSFTRVKQASENVVKVF